MNRTIYLLLIGILTLPGLSLAGTVTEQFHGVSYGPFHKEGQSPDLYTYIPSAQIRADLGMISRANFIHIRTFALDNNLDQVPNIAEKYYPKLKLWLGIYESSVNHNDSNNTHATRWQLNRAVELANSYDNVVGIIVGDECLYGDARAGDHWISAALLLEDLAYVDESLVTLGIRNRVVLTANLSWGAAHGDQSDLNGNIRQQLLANHNNIDVWMINIYPYYAGGYPLGITCNETEIRNNLDWNKTEFTGLYGSTGKPIVIGEHGWPTAGDDYGRSHPSIDNQRLYFRVTSKWLRECNWSALFFEFFDEPWKANSQEPGDIGPHWGLCYSSGVRKWFLAGFPASVLELLLLN